MAKKRSLRIVEQLRKHKDPEIKGDWKYSQERNRWIRADSASFYALSFCTIGVNGSESYRSRWYFEKDGVSKEVYFYDGKTTSL